MKSDELVLSFYDLKKTLLKAKKKILLVACILGALCFFKAALSPLKYTAKGVFKDSERASHPLALGDIDLGPIPNSILPSDSIEALDLITTQPLIERVVKKLHLQAAFETEKAPSRAARFFRSLKAEWLIWYYRFFQKVPSPIVPKTMPVAKKLPFKDLTPFVKIDSLTYDKEVFTQLHIHFLNKTHFEVRDSKKRPLGLGEVGKPFVCQEGSWTFVPTQSKPIRKGCYTLTLIPLYEAATALKESLKVSEDPYATSLVNIRYTHPNRHLASHIVNTLMDEYRAFIKEEGEHKTQSQVDYLKKRLVETEDQLQQVVDEQKHFLEDNVSEGKFFSLEEEMAFISGQVATLRRELTAVEFNVEHIKESYPTLSPLPPSHVGLTLEAAQKLLFEYNQKIDTLQLQLSEHQTLLKNTKDPSFELFTLSRALQDPTLASLFHRIRTLRLELEDTANFTTKEQESKRKELDLARSLLASHLKQLCDIQTEHIDLLGKKIETLQATLYSLLTERRTQIQKELDAMTKKLTSLPAKWQAEQKIASSTEFSSKIVESVAQLIESKNVALNLETVDSGPLSYARSNPIPNPPKILFFTLLGLGLGACGVACVALGKTLYNGPSAALPNLKGASLPVLGQLSAMHPKYLSSKDLNTLRRAKQTLLQNHPQTLLLSSLESHLFRRCLEIFSLDANRPVCIDFSRTATNLYSHLKNPNTPLHIKQEEKIDRLNAKPPSWREEELLESPLFTSLVAKLKKTYSKIIFILDCPPDAPLLHTLTKYSESHLHIVTTEKLEEIKPLGALYLVQEPPIKPPPAPIKRPLSSLEPALDALLKKIKKSLFATK